jgi:hypothetical protein
VKDVGFNYWTTGRGKKRGENSIGDRVFYSGARRDGRDVPFLKGRDIAKWSIQVPSNFLKHDYVTCLDPKIDTFRFSEEFLKIKPKVVYRQTSGSIKKRTVREGPAWSAEFAAIRLPLSTHFSGVGRASVCAGKDYVHQEASGSSQ